VTKRSPLRAAFVSVNWQPRGQHACAKLVVTYDLNLREHHANEITRKLLTQVGITELTINGQIVTFKVGSRTELADKLENIQKALGYEGLIGNIFHSSETRKYLKISVYGAYKKIAERQINELRVRALMGQLSNEFNPATSRATFADFDGLQEWTIIFYFPPLSQARCSQIFRTAMASH